MTKSRFVSGNSFLCPDCGEDMRSYPFFERGYKVLICTCHPTNVGNKIPKLAEFIIGYGVVDCVVWREYYDNSIEIYVERKDL